MAVDALWSGRGGRVVSRAQVAMRALLLALLQQRAEASGGGQRHGRGGPAGALEAQRCGWAGGKRRRPRKDLASIGSSRPNVPE